jgi:hypothetical protein
MRLIDIIEKISSIDPESTIYVREPWATDSTSVVAREPDDGGLPSQAEAEHAVYFLEVFLAQQMLEDWIRETGETPTTQQLCDRVLSYARNDA